jgi:putative thioredoxin
MDAAMAMRGAVDLGALAQAREAQAAAAERAKAREASGQAGVGAAVLDVTEATFQAEVADRSHEIPVLLDFWSARSPESAALSAVLEQLAVEYGSFVLGRIDVDAQPRLGSAFGLKSIPTVFAVIAGQPLPMFDRALPEEQVRMVIDELLKVAAENGIAGRIAGEPAPGDDSLAAADVEPPSDPDLDAAADAVAAGDLDAAAAAYERLLARVPNDPDGLAGRALIAVMKRAHGLDPQATVHAGSADGAAAEQVVAAGDVLVLSGRPEDAFALLIAALRNTNVGDERTLIRDRVLELFTVVGTDHPAVIAARPALANALF